MNTLKKLLGNISKLLFALILALLLLNVTSCDLGIVTPGTEPSSPTSPDDNNTQPTTPTSYHDFANFNPANYPIINESGKSDSDLAYLKDVIWLMYAEREDIGEWTVNYIKSNKIKTILSNEWGASGWIHPDQLDRLYLNEEVHSFLWGTYDDKANDYDRVNQRKSLFQTPAHETMHLVQYKSNVFDLMKGMRPDICAAAYLLHEFLPWFYTTYRYESAYVYADMANAVETQSKYMIIETNLLAYDGGERPKHYEDMRANDPSLPPFIIGASWFFSPYAQAAMSTGTVWGSAMTPPLIKASKEEMLKIARALLACRDPKKAGVTDEALWTAFDFLRRSVETGEHLALVDGGSIFGCSQESFDQFQELIARWDEEYATQARNMVQTQSASPSVSMAAIVW